MKKIKILVIVFIILLLPVKVHAGLQANKGGTKLVNTTADAFFKAIRAMETEYGTLAKKSNISSTDYTDSSKNGIDCHMMKNTEYGTVTILAASGYGNKPDSNGSTGANDSGLFEMNNSISKWVANTWHSSDTAAATASGTASYNAALRAADSRYVDKYVGTAKYSLPGDGILETDGWGGSTTWEGIADCPVFRRGDYGLFGYWFRSQYWPAGDNRKTDGHARDIFSSRAVVVCGSEL